MADYQKVRDVRINYEQDSDAESDLSFTHLDETFELKLYLDPDEGYLARGTKNGRDYEGRHDARAVTAMLNAIDDWFHE